MVIACETEVIERIRKALAIIESEPPPSLQPDIDVPLTLSVKASEAKIMGLSAILFGLRLIEIAAGIAVN